MKIKDLSFDVFEREYFIYRKSDSGAEQVKAEYTAAWSEWKKVVSQALLDSSCRQLDVENTENWQNSGNLSKRFWTRIKYKHLFEKPSCIAAMISKDNLKVYLEWHGYKHEHLIEERKIHNSWVLFIDDWMKTNHINPAEYRVWINKDLDESYREYITLDEFISNNQKADRLKEVLNEDPQNWIRVGRVFLKSEVLNHEDITKEMGQTIAELEWLYQKAVGNDLIPNEAESKISYQSTSQESVIKESEDKSELNKNNTPSELIHHVYQYIESKGFYYNKDEVINLFLSLKTKPFVILSGISGTGKTKMVQWFAESLGATEENGQFHLIPIRPDWNDGSDLLGYKDIKGDFVEGPLTRIIKKANESLHVPFFVLLDEMNLARVEYYFSDILSVMESRKWKENQIVTSNLLSKEITGYEFDLKIPQNLYIIGTVNMDETTHPFSKKVLDRANTIEFNRVSLMEFAFLKKTKEMPWISIRNDMLASKYLHLKDVYQNHSELVFTATSMLENINKSLQIMNAHVGYRVRDEICFYLAYNEEYKFLEYKEAMDNCILQKILPRISGSDTRVEQLLIELYRIFTTQDYIEGLDSYESDLENAEYPNSARKVVEMLRRLHNDSFTSFWIS